MDSTVAVSAFVLFKSLYVIVIVPQNARKVATDATTLKTVNTTTIYGA